MAAKIIEEKHSEGRLRGIIIVRLTQRKKNNRASPKTQ